MPFPFGMANLMPDETGLPLIVHVYKNTENRARHGPRVKAYPGRPREGNPTTLRVPGREDDPVETIGDVTISAKDLKKVVAFVRKNWMWILLYWYEPDFTERDLLENIV